MFSNAGISGVQPTSESTQIMRHGLLPTFQIHGASRWQMDYFTRLADVNQFFQPGHVEPVQQSLLAYAYRNFDIYVTFDPNAPTGDQETRVLSQVLDRVAIEKTHALYEIYSKDHPETGVVCLIKRRWENEVFRLLEEFDLKRQWRR